MRPDRAVAELDLLASLIVAAAGCAQVRTCTIECSDGARLPLHAVLFGSDAPGVPALACIGGIHGIERIGSQVVLEFMRSVVTRLEWDASMRRLLREVRLVFIPVANPAGMRAGTRSNARGVDLMRNAPVQASAGVPFLAGGQRLSRHLPWYRGPQGGSLQPECAFIAQIVERELLGRPFSMVIDCHSGFGTRDRLWFPWAGRPSPYPRLAQLHAFVSLFERNLAQHPYVVEPQSAQYLAHGDLWDWLALQALAQEGAHGRVFLPLTLEMGSWMWVKKNPSQLFSLAGLFNPLVEHRERRVLRRHVPLLEFALRATAAASAWLPRGCAALDRHRAAALARWYEAVP